MLVHKQTYFGLGWCWFTNRHILVWVDVGSQTDIFWFGLVPYGDRNINFVGNCPQWNLRSRPVHRHNPRDEACSTVPHCNNNLECFACGRFRKRDKKGLHGGGYKIGVNMRYEKVLITMVSKR